MGNLCACFSHRPAKRRIRPVKRHTNPPPAAASNRWSRVRSFRKDKFDDSELIREQAIAAAILFGQQQQQHNGSIPPFERSASLRYPNSSSSSSSKRQSLPRSSSTRARSLTDPLLQPHQLVNQNLKIADLETNHFVLVHGGGFGAWCWYKTIALLEDGGFQVTAIDLTGSGIDSFDTNGITTLSQYVKPLTDFLEKLDEGQKVILVGHDFGGACISHVIELFPHKISKAVFIAAVMLTSGQSTLDLLKQAAASNEIIQQAQIFLYGDGDDHPPTAVEIHKSLLRNLLFNQSPAKDVALASVSMRPIPFSPLLEKLSISDRMHGSVRRFYIQTPEDNAIPITLQESMISSCPPERVFRLKGADHSPFFSKPQTLHKLLVEISKIPPPKPINIV
ncbi:hypothetical protein SAY87_007627 [Trapa incisa]|uniref:AB hydrolase-1 domain-containing protein n=1 Tax=Trapa incisa TaxID=236973 RepID=A0AAN7KMK9_9MYRT|nr:hypothetical protein SAY87_007627 [Trapa incisa]